MLFGQQKSHPCPIAPMAHVQLIRACWGCRTWISQPKNGQQVCDSFGGASVRTIGAPGCCHGWSPPQADGTRGAGMLQSSSPRMGRRVCANGYESAHLRPCRGGDGGLIFHSTGSASPGLRLVALHQWQQPSVPPGPLQCRLNCHAPMVRRLRSPI